MPAGIGEVFQVGDNPKGSLGAGWFGKLAGGLAARPALPNMAGQKPPQQQQGQGDTNNRNVTNNFNATVNNQGATENQSANTLRALQEAMAAAQGKQGWGEEPPP